MKKLFNGRFLFILASSVVVLMLLTLGAFYLFDDDDDTFVKSGYVLNPLSSTSEKYFFNENAGYKENLSSMIEFVDVDENTVSVLKDSFLHYSDESLSFLKKGALLDLDSVKGNDAVAFYNITNESIIEKKDSGYYIETSTGEIKLVNFIGRISDNKYIVVGNLNLKMAGNETAVKGDYFEIVYIEEGIVNIENKDVKFQVASEGTVISVSERLKIDLGGKKIVYDKKDVMSITAITINGDENIEIIPKVEDEEEEDKPQGGENVAGDGNGNVTQGEGNDTGKNEGETTEPVDEVVITLKDVKIGSTDIDVIFEILNAREDDSFKLQVVNLNSGKTVDMVASVVTDAQIQVNLLTPKTKYLFMVVNERDNGKYFQKVIETSGFGIKLEKEYATNNSLSYKVMVDENADVTNAKLTLYKFNEEIEQNEVVKTCYTDTATNEVSCQEKIVQLSSLFDSLAGEHSVVFDGLESDTIYTVVLDEFSIASYNFKDIYNITLTSMTLKEVPSFTEMEVEKNVGTGSFDLSLGNIKDPDNAITSYTYLIYDKFTGELAIEPIVHTSDAPLTVDIGDGENKLKNNTNYYYKAIIEYFDNEKYIEYVTTDSIVFVMGDEPYITVVPNEELITHNTLGATIYLTDNSCLISMPGREKCSGASTAVVEVSRVNPNTGERFPLPLIPIEFEVNDDEIKYNLYLDEHLQPGTTYNIEVKALFNNSTGFEKQEINHTDESKRMIATKYLSSFNVNWDNYQSSANHVVNAGVRFSTVENSNTETPEETLSKIDKVLLKLYQGERPSDFTTVSPIKTMEVSRKEGVNFKELFYDAYYAVSSSDTFGMSIDQLKKLNAESPEDPGKLTEYYTLYIEAYADGNLITLINPSHQYKISSVLLLDGVIEPVIKINDITHGANNLFGNLSNGGTVVGYNVTAAFDRNSLVLAGNTPKNIHYYVYSASHKRLKFYILNSDNELVLVDKVSAPLGDEGYHETNIYMDYGTLYETVDDIMTRGNLFYIGYELDLLSAEGDINSYPSNANPNAPSDVGLYQVVTSSKESPSIKMYVSKSTANSIVYKYKISDPDLAIYKYPEDENYAMYYSVNGAEGVRYELSLVPDAAFNQFEGEIVIEGLRRHDVYNIYYQKNITKTNSFGNDVLKYLDYYSAGDKIFEGYYDPESVVENYNFVYKIINDQTRDNKVGIKIIANKELRDRILNYKLEFTATYEDGSPVVDKKGEPVKLTKELWKLSTCSDDNSTQCLYVDYSELKNAGMKSDWQDDLLIKKNIHVTVTAYYDNGLTGYDYKVGSADGDDYTYCIMQDDLIKLPEDSSNENATSGNYIVFNVKGTEVTIWNEKLGSSKGYYTYTLNGSVLRLTSHLMAIAGQKQNVSVNLTSNGYSSKRGFMNPKMVSVKQMELDGTSPSTFSFDSITPKAAVSRKAGIVNGVVLNLSLSGIDLSEVREESDNYYIYIETWSKEGYAKANKNSNGVVLCENTGCLGTVRPVVAVAINKENPLAAMDAIIDGLLTNTEYYYQVYIKKKDVTAAGYIYTQLFDAGDSRNNTTKSYLYRTGKSADLFQNVVLDLSVSEEVYGNRNIKTTISLIEYGFGIPFNFDIKYVLCDFDQANAGICGVRGEKTVDGIDYVNIFEKFIPQSDVKKSTIDTVDISEYDLEYGKKYYVYVYAVTDYYGSYEETRNSEVQKRNVRLNSYVAERSLRLLVEPTFEVIREAGFANNDYYIDFTVTAKDPDRTLINGVYMVKLVDANGVSLLTNASNCTVCLQVKNEDGVFENVSADTAFDALELEKTIRVTGLAPNTKYVFTVYNDVYINNYNPNKPKEDRTYEISRSYTVYTTNTYGVSFGKIVFNVTSNSFMVIFVGGSNFDNVVGLSYTIEVGDSLSTAVPISGSYKIPDDKQIELAKDSTEYYFAINPDGMKNQLGSSYNIGISFEVKTATGTIVLSNTDYPEFNGTVVYVEE